MDASLQNIGDVAMTQATPRLSGKLAVNGNIDKTAQDFEGMFMSQMLEPMFEGLKSDSMFGGGHGEEIMRSFLVQEYGKIAARSGHLGIAAAVKNEMIRAQAAANGGANALTE